MSKLWISLVVGLLATGGSSAGLAARQQSPSGPIPSQVPAAVPAASGRLVPLKVQLVVTRMLGEKKISSLPYTLWVTANDRQSTSLRMGVEVPVVSSIFGAGNPATVPQTSFNYRSIGTNIDCTATTVEGSYNLNITLAATAIQFDPKDASRPGGARLADAPAFSSFTSKFSILLRDGQTAQYTSASDPINGETLKVDVTLSVLK